MTSNVSAPVPGSPLGTPTPVLSGRTATGWAREEAVQRVRAGFPGAAVTGFCMVLAPPLAIAGAAFGVAPYHARGADFVAGMVAHPTSFVLGIQLSLAAMLLLAFAVIGLASMLCAVRPRLGRWAGVVTVLGITGPITFQSVYWAAANLTDTAAHRGAAALLIDESQVIPRTVMNISGPALVAGFVLLGVAAASAGVLGRFRAGCLAATALIPFGFISGHLGISLAGFVGTALALVPLGVTLLRRR